MMSGRSAWPAVLPAASEPGLMLPAWRRMLESRWRQRLAAVTSLSLAYHEAEEERSRGGLRPGGRAEVGQLLRLMQGAIAARRALFDTEEALARLSAGRYGRCEQCAGPVSAARLTMEPEARYCGRCAATISTGPPRPVHPRSAPAG
jgi:RNA polymerase-binding transcription factor DksA